EVLRAQRGQDPDHDGVRTDRAGVLLGRVEAGAYLLLEPAQAVVGQPARRHVDLDVELPELGLEVGVGDGPQRLLVAHGRLAMLVDQVELDLQPGERPFELEPRLLEHLCEHVEAPPYLLPVALPVLTRENVAVDLLTHRAPSFGGGRTFKVSYPAAVAKEQRVPAPLSATTSGNDNFREVVASGAPGDHNFPEV